jgi:hypothetical protein
MPKKIKHSNNGEGDSNDGHKIKKSKQTSLMKSGVTRLASEFGYVAQHVLLTDEIYLADPRRARTDCRFYERLVITKHRLHRIYCHKPSVKDLFIKRWKSGDWKENIDRDDTQFLELEREIFQNDFPLYYADLFDDEDDEEEEEDENNNEDKHTGNEKDGQDNDNNGLGRAKAAK